MALPRSSADYYRRQQLLVVKLLLALRHVWRRMDPTARWDQQYVDDGIGTQLTTLVTAAQVGAARDADAYVGQVLAELGLAASATGGVIVPNGFAGVAGDSRPVDSLLALSVTRAGQAFNQLGTPGMDLVARTDLERARHDLEAAIEDAAAAAERDRAVAEATVGIARQRVEALEQAPDAGMEGRARLALDEAEQWMTSVAATVLMDTARAAESAATVAREEVTGWVRMLNPPSCSRCVVLAGRFYRWNEGFLRHPLCDCRHIPADESVAGDLTVDPAAYFDSLSRAEQDKTFTKSGAQAIRDGADIGQVVNARRGMTTAQRTAKNEAYARAFVQAIRRGENRTDAGVAARAAAAQVSLPGPQRLRRDKNGLFTTDEGTSMRGRFAKLQQTRAAAGETTSWTRLMPESIYEIATDRDDAIRLLERSGFIVPDRTTQPTASTGRTRASDGTTKQSAGGPSTAGDGSGAGGRPPTGPGPVSFPEQPPDPGDRQAWLTYWRSRQDALGDRVDFHGDTLKPHEVEFVERFLARGEQISWIENDPATATSDFRWRGREFELKSTKAKASTIRGRILDAASRAWRNHKVVKDRFVIDLGAAALTGELTGQLEVYNAGRRSYRVRELWVLSENGDQLTQIHLRTQ